MNAVDTNVLLYVHDPRDPVKQIKAANLLRSFTDGALIWQVACEYIAASRKLEAHGFSQQQAWIELRRLQTTCSAFSRSCQSGSISFQLITKLSLSFWDALILAVAVRAGITTLYSEDFSGIGPHVGLRVVNPFLP